MLPPSTNHPPRTAPLRRQGFTLIELLMVIAVVLILAGITFGISRGVQNAQARAKAQAELAIIATALEQYKSRFGDYPWHDSSDGDYPSVGGGATSSMMLYALTGRMRMEREPDQTVSVSKISDNLDNSQVEQMPKFLDVTKFSYQGTDNAPEALIDPWGNPYIYWYKWENNPGDWDVFGYHLYSMGPNGNDANSAITQKIDQTTGVMQGDFRDVANQEGIIFHE